MSRIWVCKWTNKHYQVEDGRGAGGRVDMAAEGACFRHLPPVCVHGHHMRHLLIDTALQTTVTLPDADIEA